MRIAGFWQFLLFHMRRAARWNLRGLPLGERELAKLRSRGIESEGAAAYLAWRRSTFLILTGLTLLNAGFDISNFIDFYSWWPAGWTQFGIVKEGIRHAAVAAMPAAACAATLTWARPRVSRGLALAGWCMGLLAPIILAFFPLHWSVNLDALSLSQGEQNLNAMLRMLEIPVTANAFMGTVRQTLEYVLDLIGAIVYGVTLLPALLALIPGTLRGCLRVKLIAPESIVPSWFLVALVPFYVLLWLVVVAVVVNVRAGPLILGAVILMAIAPLAYLLPAPRLVRPLTPDAAQGIARVRLLATVCVAAALALLVLFLATKEVVIEDEHLRLVGLDVDTSVMMPWDPLGTCLDYLTRAMFTTAVMTDLFLQMHLSAWRRMRAAFAAEQAADHERQVAEFARALVQ
jgi:hypothetical protein